ncbi:MAG: ABC transporter ATP-binding protein [Rectinemataceae bacterium]|nr:ABC transporter ATP-binding protein [Rectinemataceae bacterium]
MAQLRLVDVTKRFNKVTAVDRLNLEVEKGECFSFLGPSGCGKTTTLRMIAGFEDLDEGELSVDGKIFSSSYKKYYLPPENRDFGMVFQAFAVWPHLTVRDNVAFPLQIRRVPKHEMAERVRLALQSTGLTKHEDSFPAKLSGGEQQRIALARAIAINPKVMLLDEPLSNLDAKLREEMRFEIKDLQKKFGFTIIYVTHDQAEAMALSDRMLVMKEGVVQQIAPPLEIYEKPVNKFVFSFIGLSNFIPVEVRNGAATIAGTKTVAGMGVPNELGESALLACRPSDIEFVNAGASTTRMGNDSGAASGQSGAAAQGSAAASTSRAGKISGVLPGAVPGRVVRRSYLGDIVDYRIAVGNSELRVQKTRRAATLREGESCGIRFNRILWYPHG